MAQLSPKQYIQTKARSLPVYKCLVNKDWESARLANIIVMRRHVNGNVTAGFYLVDLLCLGVKDTLYFFNEPEAEIEERLTGGGIFDNMFMPADYNLVHNVVYAGHDFALDYQINPHADFAVTRFILEEDDDNIPLIEIEVGEDDKPHLFVTQPGQHSDALAKLKKYAGEGNYYYTIAEDDEFEDDEEDEEDDGDYDEEFEDIENLDEINIGELTPLIARDIVLAALLDEQAFNKRQVTEKLTLNVESRVRILGQVNPYFSRIDEMENPTEDYLFSGTYSWGVGIEQEKEFDFVQQKIVGFYEIISSETENTAVDVADFLLQTFNTYKSNPLVVVNISDTAFAEDKIELVEAIRERLNELAVSFPAAELMLALEAFIKNSGKDPFEYIYNSGNIREAFPGISIPGDYDINLYCLLQVLVNLANNNLKQAIHYYYIAAETEIFIWHLPFVQNELATALDKELDVIRSANKSTMRVV